jgi:hypothetical protein
MRRFSPLSIFSSAGIFRSPEFSQIRWFSLARILSDSGLTLTIMIAILKVIVLLLLLLFGAYATHMAETKLAHHRLHQDAEIRIHP